MKLQSLIGKKASSLALKTYVKRTYPKRFRKFRRKIENDCGFVSSRANGITFRFDGKPLRISTIYLHSTGYEGYKRYRRPLPGRVRFRYKREDIRAMFGLPTKSSDGGGTFYGMPVPAWDSYKRSNGCLHFKYHRETGHITMITLMPVGCEYDSIEKRKSGCIQDKIKRASV